MVKVKEKFKVNNLIIAYNYSTLFKTLPSVIKILYNI